MLFVACLLVAASFVSAEEISEDQLGQAIGMGIVAGAMEEYAANEDNECGLTPDILSCFNAAFEAFIDCASQGKEESVCDGEAVAAGEAKTAEHSLDEETVGNAITCAMDAVTEKLDAMMEELENLTPDGAGEGGVGEDGANGV